MKSSVVDWAQSTNQLTSSELLARQRQEVKSQDSERLVFPVTYHHVIVIIKCLAGCSVRIQGEQSVLENLDRWPAQEQKEDSLVVRLQEIGRSSDYKNSARNREKCRLFGTFLTASKSTIFTCFSLHAKEAR